jgi:DNA-binding LacI/PurR family transcriptional regulator
MPHEIKNIAVVSSNPLNGFAAQLLWSMQEASLESAHDLEIYYIRAATKKGGSEYLYEKIAREKKVSAVIVIAYTVPDRFIRGFKEAGITPVLIDTQAPGVCSVNTNNEKGGYDAVKFLLETGRKKIGLITADTVYQSQKERFAGYKRALEEKGRNVDESLIWTIKSFDYNAGKEAFRFMLSSDVDGVFCPAGDYVAHGFLNEARKQNFDIPHSMSLIGYDDIEMSADTGLTTVHQPLYEMAQEAFRMAANAIDNPGAPVEKKVLENTLIIRETA